MIEDIRKPGEFVETGKITAGGSANNVKEALTEYFRNVTGPVPHVTRQCYDDLDQPKDCSLTVRYEHACPATPLVLCDTCRTSVGGSTVDCLDSTATVCVVPEADINDSTVVASLSWSERKVGANDANYITTNNYALLSTGDRTLVDELRAA
jgi:hypothetical protein